MDPTYLYAKGIQAGYNPDAGPAHSKGRWMLKNGTYCTREEALGEIHPNAVYGSRIEFDIAPLSTKLDNFERVVLGGLSYDRLRALQQSSADHMPIEILASMKLSEFYMRTEGDLFTTVVVPIQLALRDVQVQSDDKGVERELAEIYEEIELQQKLLWNWLCIEQYGQAFPLEVWDGNNISGIVLLDPKYMKVGKQISLTRPLYLTAPEEGWDTEALETQIHPMVYHSFGSDWNEQAAQGHDIPLDNDRCFALFDFKLPFQRYAIPPMSRCFRSLSTRQILEEMQRATIEGFRNQLWVFKLIGHDGTAAPPAAIAHLNSLVSGAAGERTGYFVWGGTDLIVEQHAPQSLDVLMGNDMWLALTLHIYRQRGLNLRLVTGESPQGQAGDIEWDIQVFMERMKFQRSQILRFEKHLRKSIASVRGKAWQEAKTEVHMVKPDMELQTLVERELRPLGQAGWLSKRTILEKAGYSYDVELQRKKDEESEAHLFLPPPTFSQGTSQIPVTTQESPTGRPPGAKDKDKRQEVKGQMEFDAQDAGFDGYVNKVYDLFDPLVENPSKELVDAFIDGMKEVNASEIIRFAVDGYAVGGGAFEVDPDWIRGATNFVNSFADSFRTDLYGDVDAGRNLDDRRWRVYLYPQEGRHLGYMWGLQQAMREHGARAWKRVLHPELSETGPCMACITDSMNIHPITVGFWEPHPSGVCSAMSIAYYTAEEGMPIEVPIPKKYVLPGMIRKLLERLGRLGKSIVRRVRRD